MLESILAFIGATILLALSPGPDNIYVLTQGITNGAKAGLATTAGLITGCIVHTTLIAFGVSALIVASPKVYLAIKVVGAVYLLYLAYKVYRADSAINLSNEAERKSNTALFKQGVIMNILNPKVMLFFLALFPAFLWQPEGDTVLQFYVLGSVFMVTSFVVFGAIALLAGVIASYIRKQSQLGVVLKWLQIAVFIGIAIYILL